MPILGTGLVTADGELWRTQRLLLGPALRTEMLDEVRERRHQLGDLRAFPELIIAIQVESVIVDRRVRVCADRTQARFYEDACWHISARCTLASRVDLQ